MTDPRSILAAGEFWTGSTGCGLNAGLRDLGWDVGEVEAGDYIVKRGTMTMRIAARLLAPIAARAFNAAVLTAADRLDPACLLTVKGNHLTAETLHALGRKAIRRVNFYPDVHFRHRGFDEGSLDGYDLVATTKSFQVDYLRHRLGAERVAFIHHGYVQQVHHPRGLIRGDADYRWDLSFIGNASPSKLAWLAEVARAFPDRSMIVVGNGWRDLARGTPLERAILGHELIGDHFARVIERSRINIAVHHGAADHSPWQDRVSTRTFEIPACRGFMLHIDNDEVRGLFDMPAEIDTFATPAELVDKIGFYLPRVDLRAAMIERAFVRCVPAYSLASRAAEIAARL